MNLFVLILGAFVALSSGCARMPTQEHPLTLDLPEPEIVVVQHSREAEERRENPLYLPARRIMEDEFGTPAFQELLKGMKNVMHATGGIGIAANQVGKRLQVFIIEAAPTNPRYNGLAPVPYQVFVNPRIVAASPERRNFWHGCLSAVGEMRGNVATYEWIEVEAAGADGTRGIGRLSGLAAVIFQHELRHLLGGTYLDKARTFLGKEELDAKLDRKELPFFEKVGPELPLLLDDYRIGETLEDFYQRTHAVRVAD